MAEYERILITGGAGFIGSNYVRYVLSHHPDSEVVVLDKLTYAGNLENLRDLSDRITFIQGDIANPADVGGAMNGIDAVVNFAAESHVDRSLMDPRPFIRTNVEGTLVLVEEARRRKVRRFLQVSTDEVYGDVSGTNRHSVETDPLRPRSPYAATKAAAEHLALSYGISYGLNLVVTRGSNTYGPYQYPEKIIPLFITNALEDKPLPLYNDGSAVRDYLYVEDHCSGIDLVLHRGNTNGVYNLGARVEVSGREVARRILETLVKPASLVTFVPDRPGHDYRYSVDPASAEALGWVRRWPFNEGLKHTAAWYITHTPWWKHAKEAAPFKLHNKGWYEERAHM